MLIKHFCNVTGIYFIHLNKWEEDYPFLCLYTVLPSGVKLEICVTKSQYDVSVQHSMESGIVELSLLLLDCASDSVFFPWIPAELHPCMRGVGEASGEVVLWGFVRSSVQAATGPCHVLFIRLYLFLNGPFSRPAHIFAVYADSLSLHKKFPGGWLWHWLQYAFSCFWCVGQYEVWPMLPFITWIRRLICSNNSWRIHVEQAIFLKSIL